MRHVVKLLLAVGLLAAGMARAAEPGASDWAVNDAGQVRLVSATTATGDAASLRLGLQFDLKPGWKIYWRTPGDAGYPPKLDWSGSENLGTPEIRWPAPKRFVLAGLQNHGYADEVVLPVDVPVARPGEPARAVARLDYLACAQICVPMEAELALDLPAGPAAPSAFLHDIGRFDALVPGDGARHGLAVERLEAVGDGDAAFLRATIRSATPLEHPDIFVEPPEVASFDQPRVSLSEAGRVAVIEAPVVPGTLQRPLVGGPVTVTVVDGIRSLEASLTPTPGSGAALAPQPAEGGLAVLAGMLGVALLGGLILNLMPCVLPVLSIKVVGAIGHGGAQRGHVRAAFLASATGIVASFLALAGAAVAVKAAGQAVGWGIQFQQPAFLAVMIAILTAFAANLWGLFEVPLPAFLTKGGNGRPHHTLFGHFLSGAFATLLATPCSAPFLGTAVGFALARGPSEIVAIFAALGVGMAAPYLAVAVWPAAAQKLPKPGPWMITLKKVLALALVGTAAWLGSILVTQAGPGTPAADGGTGKLQWVAFDEAAIPRLVGEGKVVFVDVTADWCITCKVNKAAVLDGDPVTAMLSGPATVAMRADWTKPSDAIARYLASFGRYGIPFNAVYGPGAPHGIPLPELLTEAEVLAAVERAKARP
ncbi:MAG: protein-disulfide reductase DsbD domain-containing protein [Pseudomonadota bacterium]